MVCQRCIYAVEQQLNALGITPLNVQLGEVTIEQPLTRDQESVLKANLAAIGFEVLDDEKQKLIERIKTIVIEKVHYQEGDEKLKFSAMLSQQLNKDYSYLSNLFSEVEGITIEKFIIEQKIERVKELLIYDELNLSEIAFKTGYSSVAHLSAQFKKITGLTPSAFKQMGIRSRKSLDKI